MTNSKLQGAGWSGHLAVPSGVIVHLFYHLLIHLLMVLHAIMADSLRHDARWREAQALVHSVHSALVHIV